MGFKRSTVTWSITNHRKGTQGTAREHKGPRWLMVKETNTSHMIITNHKTTPRNGSPLCVCVCVCVCVGGGGGGGVGGGRGRFPINKIKNALGLFEEGMSSPHKICSPDVHFQSFYSPFGSISESISNSKKIRPSGPRKCGAIRYLIRRCRYKGCPLY